jgi:hypothetical protein
VCSKVRRYSRDEPLYRGVTTRHDGVMPTTVKLPVVVPIRLAGRLFGMERSATYDAVKAGTFPVPTIRAGGRWFVSTAELRQKLGLSAEELTDVLDLDGASDGL